MANCLLTMAVLLTSNKQTAFPETFFFFFKQASSVQPI